MIGNVGSIVTQAAKTQEPPFHIDAPTCIEPPKTATVTVTKGKKSAMAKPKPRQEALKIAGGPAQASKPITTAITTALPTTPEFVPNTQHQAAAMLRANITQDVEDEESVNELDEANMGAFYREHDEEEEEEADKEQVQIVTPRGKTAGLPATVGVEAEVILTVVQYQAVIRDYKEHLLIVE
jgi:hypothetical protein